MELNTMSSNNMRHRDERRYSVPHGPNTPLPPAASEDLHAWSIYRQNLNSDFTDSALGSSDKSPLPYGNFQLRDTTVQSILNHPRYGPKSPLGSNMYTYLKFGLPRVLPPNSTGATHQRTTHRPVKGGAHINRGYRDSSVPGAGSSGYDSSDNETSRSRMMPSNMRKFRSESDFRAIGGVPTLPSQHNHRGGPNQANIPLAALRQANSRASIAGTHVNHQYATQNGKYHGGRSYSEADLLENEMIGYDNESAINTNHRLRPNQQHQYSTAQRRQSYAELVYPNIQVHCLDVDPSLRGISLNAKAGDLFAIMATSHKEGTLLAETLAGLKKRLAGEILINGQVVSRRNLTKLCGFVPSPQKSSLDPRMSVQSTIHFHASLCGPMNKHDLRERMDVLIEDLGLKAVQTANISRLTHSEKQRLSIACQLLTNASILVLDQVTTNMDIFDTFFLVEYLRQWSSSGRIVIMTLQPPTFEILSMCSGVLLLSGGRTVFSGIRSNLPRHMGSLGYPCPPFKNPADYYLDLVTLDDLSAAAMLESSARIESLVNAWNQVSSEPTLVGPPANLPMFINRASFVEQTIALAKRFMFYKQPGSLLNWISKLIAAAVFSLFIGWIFWDVPATDPQLNLNDRLGYHHCMMALSFWPILLLTIRDVHIDRKYAENDIDLGLYGRTAYILIQSLFNLLPSLFIWLALLLPAHSMAGLYSYTSTSNASIYLYMGNMLLYLTVVQSIALLCTHLLNTKSSAFVLTAILILAYTSVGGYSIHLSQISTYWSWMEYISPERWLLPVLLVEEYSHETLMNTVGQQLCRNKQVQHQEIIVQHQCPPPNGTVVLADHLLQLNEHVLDSAASTAEQTTVIALVVASISLFVMTYFIFILNIRKMFKKKQKNR